MVRRPGIADVEVALERITISGVTARTPLVPSPWLSSVTDATVWLKLESLQPTGSYKIRGAANALARLADARPDVTTVVTASAGNHGQAVAFIAKRLGLRARVHVPSSAPLTKRTALVDFGAEVVEAVSYEEAESNARREAAATGLPFVSPYNDADVIAGAGTVALEMLEDRPELDTVVVPLGGGGLLSGTAIAMRGRRPDALVIGAEAAASPVFTAALALGRPVTIAIEDTLADGLAGNMDADSVTFEIVRDLVNRVDRASERAIASAMRQLIVCDRLVAEGASAAALAAVVEAGRTLAGRQVGVILSGRNVDPSVIESLFHRAVRSPRRRNEPPRRRLP